MSDIDPKYLSWFKHEDHRRFVAERLGSDAWITVYESSPESNTERHGYFSALIANDRVSEVLKSHTWDLHIGQGRPGFTVYGDETKPPEYSHFDWSEAVPLVLVRDFDGDREGYCELLEEFRLFHNLYQDKSGKFFKVDDNGDEEEIARIGPKKVEVKLRAIRQFCAVKATHLAVYFEFDRYSPRTLADLGMPGVTQRDSLVRVQGGLLTYECWAGSGSAGAKNAKSFSRMGGKKLFAPLPIEQCGLDPYDAPPAFEEFIIGTDGEGNPKTFTCNPEALANNFGKNRGAPHFLTPVFFRKDVLAKYFNSPSRYQIEDGHLRRKGSWGLRLDNNHKEYVIVFLGDLGQSLSQKEQLYWKSHNVPPDGTISETNFRRSFLGEWADAESVDLVFKAKFDRFSADWTEAHGWPLFKPLAADDEHLLAALHIPLAEDQSEFDSQVLGLAKTLVDSLNEKMLADGVAELPKDAKGITKFEKFFESRGLANLDVHVRFLRNLYDLRSSGVGHRKSENYEKAAAKFDLAEGGFRATFEDVLRQAIALLDALEAAREAHLARTSAATGGQSQP